MYNKVMLTYIMLIVLSLFVLILLFWQISNIRSIMLGAPAISSPKNDLWKSLADRRRTILDLGCGNGSLALCLAPYFKHVYGIEYSPFYYIVAKLRTAGVRNITIYYGDLKTLPWPPVNFIYCYLLPDFIRTLEPRLQEARDKGSVIVSFGFPVSKWKPSKINMNRQKQRLFIYQ